MFQELDDTSSTNSKIEVLTKYFHEADSKDALWTISLFLGKRPKRSVQLNKIREWAAEVCDIPHWLFEESYHVIGDLAETVAILLPPPTTDHNYSLSEFMLLLQSLKNQNEEEKKSSILNIWSALSRIERFTFIKFLTGGFRVGVSKKTIIKSLSKFLNVSESIVSHRLMGNWTPESITFNDLLVEPNRTEEFSIPYPFYLAYALEGDLDDLGSPDAWSAEYKWDGIRGQIIKRQNQIFVWTRGEELVTDRNPEFDILYDVPMDDFVLDGEIIGWKSDKVLPFSDLQKRLNRKSIGKKLLNDIPIAFIAYDLLEYNAKDLRGHSFDYRKKVLSSLIENINLFPTFQISKEIPFESWNELYEIRNNARHIGAEGLMLKKMGGSYKIGRKKGDWWKWKVDPFHIDAVLLYAMRGHGRRSNLFSDFTFAVKGEGEDQLIPFAKAYSGLTDYELNEITKFVNQNTKESFGPVKSVIPELVFEISFEGISKSSRHKSGIAVRFPRISKWRHDKKVEDINTLTDLKNLLKLYA